MTQETISYEGVHLGARLLRSTRSRLARWFPVAVLVASVLGSIGTAVAASPASAAAAGSVAGWNPQQAPSGVARLHAVFCANVSVCFATGWTPSPTTEWGYAGAILATTDGGAKWSSQSFPKQFGNFNQPCITQGTCGATVFLPYGGACPTVSECFIAGYEVSSSQGSSEPALLETTDGGAKWTVDNQLGAQYGGIGQSLNDVSCAGSSDCWAVESQLGLSGPGGASVFATTDGGSSWAPQALPSNISDLWKVDAISSTDIWAVGSVCPHGLANDFYCASGTAPTAAILSTTTGGAKWTEQSVPSGMSASYLDGVSFGSASDGVAAGFICRPTSCASGSTLSPVILSTTNGGATWGAVQVPGQPSAINDVSCAASSSDCWAVGTSSTTSPPILSSTDGGATWTLQALASSGNTLMGITAPSNTDGFTVGQVCPGGNCSQKTGSAVILSTTDGGVPAPTLDPLSPSSGTAAGANPVTLTGSGFGTTAGATSVSFGGTDASSVSCASPTSCTAKVPPAPSGATLPDTVEVAVTVGGLTSNWTAYTYLVASPAPGSTFTPITPYRVCDTRSGNPSGLMAAGTDLAQCEGKTLGAGGNSSTLTIPIASTYADTVSTGADTTDGVPAGATAVVLNVTAIHPAAGGYLTVWPAGTTQPTTSSVNYRADAIVPNLVEVALSNTGSCIGCISIYASASTDVVVDVSGYYGAGTTGSSFTPITPYRVCDTRSGNPSQLASTDLTQCEGKTLATDTTLSVPIAATNPCTTTSCPGTGGVPAGATAVVLNVTAINPSSGGYLTVWPAGVAQPVVSNLNFTRGEVVANSVIVPVSSSGKVSVYNSSGTTNIAVDVAGYFSTTGATFTGTTPYRACDTRTISAVGYATPCSGTTLGTTGKTMTLSVAGVGPVPSGATAVVLNVTAVDPSVGGYLTVWPTGGTQPIVSNLNFTPRDVVANAVTVEVGTSGQISLAVSGGTTNVIVDVVGWYS